MKTYEEYLEMVKNCGHALEIVPEELRDKEMCLEAVKKNGWALQYVPDELRDDSMNMGPFRRDIR